jgi:hypothetical protein
LEGDFFLADLFAVDNESFKENLSIILQKDHYVMKKANINRTRNIEI